MSTSDEPDVLSKFASSLEWILDLLVAVVQVDEALPRTGLERVPIGIEALAVTFATVIVDQAVVAAAAAAAAATRSNEGGEETGQQEQQEEKSLPATISDGLVTSLTYLMPMAKVRSFLPHVAEKCARIGREGQGFALLLQESLRIYETEAQQQQQQQQQQEDQQQQQQQKLKPELSVGGGSAALFVPTQETERVVRSARFFLEKGVGVLVRGERACGKSTAVKKVVDEMTSSTGGGGGGGGGGRRKIISLYFGGGKTSFRREDQVLVAAELLSFSSSSSTSTSGRQSYLVVIEGFDPTLESHVSYVLSLVGGRTLYSREKEDFVTIPKSVLKYPFAGFFFFEFQNCLNLVRNFSCANCLNAGSQCSWSASHRRMRWAGGTSPATSAATSSPSP